MTSTLAWFLVATNIGIFGILFVLSGWIGGRLIHDTSYVTAFRVMLLNTFLISLTFIPFHLMRLRNQAATYSAFVFARSAGTTLLRGLFVIWLGWGLTGWYAADLVLTFVLWPMLWRWMGPLLIPAFDTGELRVALKFGLPRLPHGLAQQALDAGNKVLFKKYVGLGQLGVYQNGFTLGTAVRFFTSAFETAWAPFYYATSKQPNAQEVFGKMTTYAVAVLTLLVATTVAISRDLIPVVLTPAYLPAVPVVPYIAFGMACQGLYLLTSIGLNLTSRTQFYPIATFAALFVGLVSGFILMPRLGLTGAAMAFAASGITQAVVAFAFAQRFYPIPYEVGRILRVVSAGIVAALSALWIVPDMAPIPSLLARLMTTVATFALALGLTGFFRRSERDFLVEMASRMRRRNAALPNADAK
jgi:O-antigen/teichoic acid export membrane protein